MHRLLGPRRWAVAVVVLTLGLAGCSGSGFEYDAELRAPERSEYDGSDEVSPNEDARADLRLDNGARVVIWVDLEDHRKVWQQHSDPDDPDAWTEPELLFTAGDGCLFVEADTDGEIVAATLGCYEGDAFIQQAPDQGQAVVTDDLQEWELWGPAELFEKPDIDDGQVTWQGDLAWTAEDGFER